MFTDQVSIDMITNGEAGGEIGEMMGGQRFDPGMLRPYVNNRGQKCVTIQTGKTSPRKDSAGNFINNADGQLRMFPETKTSTQCRRWFSNTKP